jgi:DNA replicative helicase MCM subunit Mcm2 (Cdc46/Mcm family)
MGAHARVVLSESVNSRDRKRALGLFQRVDR